MSKVRIMLAAWCGALALTALPAMAATEEGPRIPASERKRIAVLPFEDGAVRQASYFGQVFDVGRGVADMLTGALVNSQRFRVIEREQVAAVLAEQDLGQSGRLDPATAARVGKILGADYLVTGRVTEFAVDTRRGAVGTRRGDLRDLRLSYSVANVALDGRLVDSTTAEILFAFNARGRESRTDLAVDVRAIGRLAFDSPEFRRTILGAATREAVEASAARIADNALQTIYQPRAATEVTGYVVYTEGPRIMINLGARYGVQAGDRFEIVRRTREIHDPETGELLTVLTVPVGVLRVEAVEEKVATGSLEQPAGDMMAQIGDLARRWSPSSG